MPLRSRLPQIAAELPAKLDAIVKAGAEVVERNAKARAPDATPLGQGLVAAIHVEHQGTAEYAVVAGDSDVFWGHMVEHGTTHAAPHPFLVPALEESRDEVLGIARAGL